MKIIELGEREVEEARHVLAEENFVSRTIRHLTELKVSSAGQCEEGISLIARICQRISTASLVV